MRDASAHAGKTRGLLLDAALGTVGIFVFDAMLMKFEGASYGYREVIINCGGDDTTRGDIKYVAACTIGSCRHGRGELEPPTQFTRFSSCIKPNKC